MTDVSVGVGCRHRVASSVHLAAKLTLLPTWRPPPATHHRRTLLPTSRLRAGSTRSTWPLTCSLTHTASRPTSTSPTSPAGSWRPGRPPSPPGTRMVATTRPRSGRPARSARQRPSPTPPLLPTRPRWEAQAAGFWPPPAIARVDPHQPARRVTSVAPAPAAHRPHPVGCHRRGQLRHRQRGDHPVAGRVDPQQPLTRQRHP
jgi:hypothetical protein